MTTEAFSSTINHTSQEHGFEEANDELEEAAASTGCWSALVLLFG